MPKYWDCKLRSFRTEELCRGWQGPSRNKSAVEIDNHPVVATYCPPAINTDTVTSHAAASQQWRTAHVRESQYCLQLVRCNDHQCCTPWRSPLQNLLPCRFLPNPVPAKHSGQGIVTSNADNAPTFLPIFVNLQLNIMVQKKKMGSSSSHHMIWTVHL